MCGIFFSCCNDNYKNPSALLQDDLAKRGPDHCNTTRRKIEGSKRSIGQTARYLSFFSAVLSLRGDHVIKQPLLDQASSSVLCWNGEAWKIDGRQVWGNDAEIVFNLLLKATIRDGMDQSRDGLVNISVTDQIMGVFSRIEGPYAFVYYHAPSAQIYYGRDVLGRRSLLTNTNTKDSFVISSICSPDAADEWAEVEADGIYRLDLCVDGDVLQPAAITQEPNDHLTVSLPQLTATRSSIESHLIMSKSSKLPPLNKAMPTASLPALNPSSLVVEDLAKYLEASLRLRVEHIPLPPCERIDPPRLAVLFSGGLDCTLLARMVHDIVPTYQEIDLVNVAFENPRVTEAAAKRAGNPQTFQSPYASCPDRITGSSSHQELMRVCPQRKWRFVCINVPYTEMIEHRPHIISLIQPHNTEMDLSIACALYFAARGRGLVHNEATNLPEVYTTPARVLLSGLGADEIFGGYQRHATAFRRGGYSALIIELELDFGRLGKRNLGRDDRVLSHWGREVRYPFLDECLVTWALGLPVWEKCGFGAQSVIEKEPGNGLELGKELLRLLATRMSMHGATSEKKRAIQFGARTAKMQFGKIKGTESLF